MTITTKFKPDDVLFFMKNNAVVSGKVSRVNVTIYSSDITISYLLNSQILKYEELIGEGKVFGTKQDLLASL